MEILLFLLAYLPIPHILTHFFGFRLIGLTGGISTGKSTCTKKLRDIGIPVIDFDEIARDIVRPGTSTLKTLEVTFGKDIINSDGSLNREALGKIIFKDKSKRVALNNIMSRPLMVQFILRTLKYLFLGLGTSPEANTTLLPGLLNPMCGSRVVILDAPLLFEYGLNKVCSEVLFVSASGEVQLERLMKRDGISAEQAKLKINAQLSTEKKEAMSTHVITNNGSKEELSEKLDAWLLDAMVRAGTWDKNKANQLKEENKKNNTPLSLKNKYKLLVPGFFYMYNPFNFPLIPTLPSVITTIFLALPSYFLLSFVESWFGFK